MLKRQREVFNTANEEEVKYGEKFLQFNFNPTLFIKFKKKTLH
jgi:hypothetical protein